MIDLCNQSLKALVSRVDRCNQPVVPLVSSLRWLTPTSSHPPRYFPHMPHVIPRMWMLGEAELARRSCQQEMCSRGLWVGHSTCELEVCLVVYLLLPNVVDDNGNELCSYISCGELISWVNRSPYHSGCCEPRTTWLYNIWSLHTTCELLLEILFLHLASSGKSTTTPS